MVSLSIIRRRCGSHCPWRTCARPARTGTVLQQSAEDLDTEIARQQIGQDLALVRLVLIYRQSNSIIDLIRIFITFDHRRNKRLGRWGLRYHRLEFGIEQRADIELTGFEQVDHLAADILRIDEANLFHAT